MRVDLSHPEHTPAGKLLGRMWYGGFLDTALSRSEYSGCPHTGMRHTLYLDMSETDIRAFLALVEETFGDKYPEGVTNFAGIAQGKMLSKKK